MSNYKIEKGVKIQNKAGYPFSDMEVGDSFLIPLDGKKANEVQMRVGSSSRSFRNGFNKTFAIKTRREGDAIRVFRIN